jgi:hypothetical protein
MRLRQVRLIVPCLWLASICLVFTGCGDDAVESYSVPKGSEVISRDSPATPAAAESGATATPDGGPAPAQHVDTPGWIVPERWRVSPDQAPMRLMTFVTAGQSQDVTIAVTRFPGDVGGTLANVNRWRGQIQLPPVDDVELQTLLTRYASPGFDGYLVHLRGTDANLIAAGVYEASADRTWFVRATTTDADAEQVRQDILAFAKSFGTVPPHRHDSVDGSH